MKNYELSLVLFTVLSQFAVGLAMFTAWQSLQKGKAATTAKNWGYVTVLMALALGASLFHLGHPSEAYRTMAHLGVAWLSMEILLGGVFAALAALTFIRGGATMLGLVTAVVGIAFVVVQGFTYAPVAQSALANALPMTLFALTALILGAASWQCLQTDAKEGSLSSVGVLKTGLYLWLALMLIVPCIWVTGGTVMLQTAQGWVCSGFYWTAILLTIMALILLIKKPSLSPFAVVLALFCAAVLGRLTFFAETASTFNNIGAPF